MLRIQLESPFSRHCRRHPQTGYYEDVYSQLIASGSLEGRAVDIGSLPWCEIDTPQDYDSAIQKWPMQVGMPASG